MMISFGRLNLGRFITALFVILLLIPRSEVHALSTLTDLYDQPTSLVASAESNHKFVFTTAGIISAGDVLSIEFPAGFNPSSMVLSMEDAVDISDDGVEISTAATCAGTEQASVETVSDVIVITFCSGDGGGIASGSAVIVEIGTNASAYGSGEVRVVNPSVAGTYYVDIESTGGINAGSVALPIMSAASSHTPGVSATVQGSGGSGGGGGGGGGGGDESPGEGDDDLPPEIPEIPQEPDGTPVDPIAPPGDDGETTPPTVPGAQGGDESAPARGDTSSSDGEDDDMPGDGGDNPGPTEIDVEFIVNDVVLSGDETIPLLSGTAPEIRVEIRSDEEVSHVNVMTPLGTVTLLPTSPSVFVGRLPSLGAGTTLITQIVFENGDVTTRSTRIAPVSGHVVERSAGGELVAVPGAMVAVYLNGGLWSTIGENPQISAEGGEVGWYAPNGTYTIIAQKAGYLAEQLAVTVRDGLLTPFIEMHRTDDTVAQVGESPVVTPPPVVTPVESVPPVLASFADIASLIENAVDTPEVKNAASVAAPIVAVSAAASVAVLATSFSLLPYLQYLFTAPLLFWNRRKRQAFGTVYHSVTKVPIELAIVRVYRMSDKKLVKSVVTNAQGQFSLFLGEPGDYRLEVSKGQFAFPSRYLADVTEDGERTDLYHGQVIRVNEKNALITPNIPLDPLAMQTAPSTQSLRRRALLRKAQLTLAPLGSLVSLGVAFVIPSLFTWILAGVQFVTLLLVWRLVRGARPAGWSYVADKKSGRALPSVVVRLFEPRYNKLIESTLTDTRGRFAFLLGPNEYYVRFDKPGYETATLRPVDYRSAKTVTPLTTRVDLARTARS